MKTVATLLFSLVLAVSFAQADITKEFKTAKGKKLEIELETGGSLSIKGWDKDVVSITIEGDEDDIEYDIDEKSWGISARMYTIDGDDWGRGDHSLNYEIRVPTTYDLSIDSKGGGVTIDGVEGEIEGGTMGGELTLSRLKGMLRLQTMGGEVTLTDSDVDGSVKTFGGKVKLENVTGNVKGNTMGGAIAYNNVSDRKGRTDGKEVEVSTMGGNVNVDEAPYGANVSTMGGDIEVRSAADHVEAKTMGGDIVIKKIDGRVRAETMGGDIEVTMTGDPSKGDREVWLDSKGGDITLTVPAGLSMEVDISIMITKRSRRDAKIVSDFPLNIEESKDWERDGKRDTPRRYRYATGSVAGGKHKIRIRTIEGNVYLKKGN